MPRIPPVSAQHLDGPHEAGAPPHAERPDAAAPSTPAPSRRRARGRTLRLAAAAVAVAALASACVYDPGPSPSAGPGAVAPAAPGTPPVEHWYALAQCETGGNWGAPGPTYVGGLGMYAPNWDAHGGLQYAPSANLASPEQQIAVATNLWLAGGSWGCKIGDGWDHR